MKPVNAIEAFTALSARTRWLILAIAAAVLATTACAIDTAYGLKSPEKPDFMAIEDVEVRKHAFFDFLLPYIETSNREILQTRRELLSLRERKQSLDEGALRKVQGIAQDYELAQFDAASEADWDELLRRVDIVPPSLALAQAANESAWGTSRFANQGQNFFGQWCFDPGCGIVPQERPADATYEVADFDSAQHSVERYMHNLNHHDAYRELRQIRALLRQRGERITGMALAEGLENYSERGREYVDMIRTIISANDLATLDPRA